MPKPSDHVHSDYPGNKVTFPNCFVTQPRGFPRHSVPHRPAGVAIVNLPALSRASLPVAKQETLQLHNAVQCTLKYNLRQNKNKTIWLNEFSPSGPMTRKSNGRN